VTRPAKGRGPPASGDAGRAFIERSRHLLARDFLPRLRGALARLDEEDVWWRPNPASNSVGNLLLHLAGNVRQWIVSGVGGEEDVRRRDEEFARTGGLRGAEALETLERAVEDADRVLGGLDPARLRERLIVQGLDVSVLEAVYHVVEHFSMHTGQVLYVAKLRTGEDLGFWHVGADGTAEPRW